MRRIAALTAVLFAASALVLTTGSAALADTPPDQLTITSPVNGSTSVPYGTTSLTFAGTDKRAGDKVLVDERLCPFITGSTADGGTWSCNATFIPLTPATAPETVTFNVRAFNTDEGPIRTIDVKVLASQFSVTTPSTTKGKKVTVTGVYDTADPMTDVSAVLKHAGDADVPTSCVLDPGGTYTCTFTGVSPKSGYTVEVTQSIEDSNSLAKTTGAFTVKSKTPPPPPPPTSPPTNPPPTNPPPTNPPPTIPPPTIPPPANPPPANPPPTSPPTVPGTPPPHVTNPFTPPPVTNPSSTSPPAATTPSNPQAAPEAELTLPAAKPDTSTTPSATADPSSADKKSHHNVSDATKRLLQFGIAGIVLMGIGGGRGLARSALGVSSEGKVVFAWRDDGEVKRKVDLTDKLGPGDRSPTWRFPWHAPIDAVSLTAPSKLAPRSPFLGRLAADGAEIRAAFGTLWLLFPAAGAVLGALALADTSGHAVPPAYWLVLTITVLAVFDALAGAIATLVFFGGILISGGFWNEAEPDFAHSVLVFLILSLLWTSLPLIGTATRPFRRLGKPSARYAWDRVADLIIASLLCAWIAQKSLEVMDLFAGTETGLEHHADQLAIVVLVMIIIRIVIEHLASIWYPHRLAAVEIDGELPPPTRAANLIGVVVRTAAYSFIGHVFIGTCWQWWLGTALFFLPQVGALIQHRFAAVELLKKLVPKGIVEIFVLIVACTLAVRYAEHHNESELEAIRYAFLALALPPALIGAVALFGGEGERGKRTWLREILGLVILIATVTLALRGWEY